MRNKDLKMRHSEKTGGVPNEQQATTSATTLQSAESAKSPPDPLPAQRKPGVTPKFTDWAAI